MPTIQSLIGTYLETIRTVIGGVLTAIQGLLNVFAGIFTGDWSRVWEGVKGIFSGVWEAIKGIAKGANVVQGVRRRPDLTRSKKFYIFFAFTLDISEQNTFKGITCCITVLPK